MRDWKGKMAMSSDELFKAANLRDLGGLRATDGRVVQSGALYRSAMLHSPDPAFLTRVRDLNLCTIVDLRSSGERHHFPTPWEDFACSEYWYPEIDHITGDLVHMLASPVIPSPATVEAHMIGIYRTLPFVHAPTFRRIAASLIEGSLPLLFHCAVGKDRTGVAAALLLSALDLPRDEIMRDYLRTNAFDIRRSPVFLAQKEGHPALSRLPECLLSLLVGAHTRYLDAMFASIIEQHGSIDTYLEAELQLDTTRRAHLRDRLLVPPSEYIQGNQA